MLRDHVERLLGPACTDAAALAPLLSAPDSDVREAAIVAAGFLGDPSLAASVAARLEAPRADERMQAAITLGVLGATQHAARLLARLEQETDRAFSAMVAALEMMKARDTVPGLLEVLRTAPKAKLWDLTHALWVITGVDPVAPKDANARDDRALEALRSAWLRSAGLLDAPPPHLSQVRSLSPDLATFALEFGRSRVRFDYEPPSPGATWPRWSQSLYIGTERVYDVGSTCGTCELYLRHLAWPQERLARTTESLETASADQGLPAWIAAWTPVLEQLRSGQYLAARLSLPVDRIDRENLEDSWFHRRQQIRAERGDEPDFEPEPPYWPGTAHYQGPRSGEIPTFPVVFPTQELGRLEEARVAKYQRDIVSGARPPVVVLGWIDTRAIRGDQEERFLSLLVLNGHHRLEAYARTHIPTPMIVVARIADSWGPPSEPDRFLREALAAYR